MDHCAIDPVASTGLWNWMTEGFMPHGHCYFWRPGVLWLHVVSDCLIALAYYSIPCILFAFVAKRRDVPFNAMFILFGVFILACGTTHVMEVVTIWHPAYWLSGSLKAITAFVSIAAALMLVPIIPKALALPSLRAANEQLQKTSIELRRSNQELEQFAYVSSHDLQEPLRMITMYLFLLEREQKDLDSRAAKHMAFVKEGAQRMQSLIDSLLAYTRVEQVPPQDGVCDANVALAGALANLQASIQQTGTHVTCGTMPDAVRADQAQLTQVFQNLIGNAIKYGTTDKPWVHISAKASGGEWIVSVQDNGIGIDPRYHEKIFAVFQRLHERSGYGGGTGIGLAITKKIIERQGGRLWVESQPGTGSTFHFTLATAPKGAAP